MVGVAFGKSLLLVSELQVALSEVVAQSALEQLHVNVPRLEFAGGVKEAVDEPDPCLRRQGDERVRRLPVLGSVRDAQDSHDVLPFVCVCSATIVGVGYIAASTTCV